MKRKKSQPLVEGKIFCEKHVGCTCTSQRVFALPHRHLGMVNVEMSIYIYIYIKTKHRKTLTQSYVRCVYGGGVAPQTTHTASFNGDNNLSISSNLNFPQPFRVSKPRGSAVPFLFYFVVVVGERSNLEVDTNGRHHRGRSAVRREARGGEKLWEEGSPRRASVGKV